MRDVGDEECVLTSDSDEDEDDEEGYEEMLDVGDEAPVVPPEEGGKSAVFARSHTVFTGRHGDTLTRHRAKHLPFQVAFYREVYRL